MCSSEFYRLCTWAQFVSGYWVSGVDTARKRGKRLSTGRHKHERALRSVEEMEGWTVHQQALNINKTDLEKGQGPCSSHLGEFVHVALSTTPRNPHQGGRFLTSQFSKSLAVSKRDVLTSTSPRWLCLLGSHPSTVAFTRTGSLLQAESSLQKAKSRCSQTCYQSKRRQRCRFEDGWMFSLFYCNSIVVRV